MFLLNKFAISESVNPIKMREKASDVFFVFLLPALIYVLPISCKSFHLIGPPILIYIIRDIKLTSWGSRSTVLDCR